MTQWGLDTLFNPAKRHMDEEKQRLQSTREQIGDASAGKRIDLESGKVTIRRGPKGTEIVTHTDTDTHAHTHTVTDTVTDAAARTGPDPDSDADSDADTDTDTDG